MGTEHLGKIYIKQSFIAIQYDFDGFTLLLLKTLRP